MKVTALMVTYNRKELLSKALYCIDNQNDKVDKLLIVNNASPDNTKDYLIERYSLELTSRNSTNKITNIYKGFLNDTEIILVNLNENNGGSGGFSFGVEYAFQEMESDWIWGMDDDAFPELNALANLKKTIEENKSTYAFWSNCDNDLNFDDDIKKVDSWMFVGFCLNKIIYNKVGNPVDDYFIYHDDSEYAKRIIRSGFDIIKVKNSVIKHGDFNSRDIKERRVNGSSISIPVMPDWKLYYYFRNEILKNNYSFKSKYKSVISKVIEFGLYTFVNKKFSSVIIKAILHGIINKKGKCEFL